MKKSKSLNRIRKSVFYPMNKRGQIIELIGVVIILSITIYGVAQVYYQKDSIYVGVVDTNTSFAYKYSECKNFINSIPRERLVVFASEQDIPNNFERTDCS